MPPPELAEAEARVAERGMAVPERAAAVSALPSDGSAEDPSSAEALPSLLTGGGGEEICELRRRLTIKEAEVRELERRIYDQDRTSGRRGQCRSEIRPLSIVIPMGGVSDEFAEAGFRLPRPLVNVVGRPVLFWMLDHLSIQPCDSVTCVVPAVMDRQHGISKLIAAHFPAHNARVITLPFNTRGWMETVFTAVQQMPPKELRRPLVTLDCSTIYHGVDLLKRCRNLPEGIGASFFFETEGAAKLMSTGSVASQFSYLRLGPDDSILEIKEKAMISAQANTGAYIFQSAKHFRVAAESLLELPEEAAKGGLYASVLISLMLKQQARFLGVRVDDAQFAILASPLQLENFIRRVSSGQVRMLRRMRFCFDLDGTLVTEPQVPGDFSTCEPVPKAVDLVRQLHEAGHTIIITTSRGMNGTSLGSAIAEVGHVTFRTLADLGIPYDELHFGKPHADVYVDSRSLNALADIERDLGWHVGPGQLASQFQAIDGAIDARSFNFVRAAGKENVIKSSKPEVLRGECHWYRGIPEPLLDLFPRLLDITEGVVAADGEAISTITMSRVAGVTFSHLMTSRLLLTIWVRRLVHALHRIHSQRPPADSPAASELTATNAELCYNYASKVTARFQKHRGLYSSLAEELGIDTQRMAASIIGFLEDFEGNERARHAHYIHGDPVFSNVIRTNEDAVVLIDMRGELGGRLTTQGDVHYDLSKVYQSLCGYDFMLLDQVPDATTSEVFDGLRAAYWEEITQLYPNVRHRDVRLHTAAHFFTIVPLHEVRSRMARYLRASHSMLLVEGLL